MANSGSYEDEVLTYLTVGFEWSISHSGSSRTGTLTITPYIKYRKLSAGATSSYVSVDGSQTTRDMSIHDTSSNTEKTKKFSSVSYTIYYDSDGDWSKTATLYYSARITEWNGQTVNKGPWTLNKTITADNIGAEVVTVRLTSPTMYVSSTGSGWQTEAEQGDSVYIYCDKISNASSYRFYYNVGSKPSTYSPYVYGSASGSRIRASIPCNTVGTVYVMAQAIGNGTTYLSSALNDWAIIEVEPKIVLNTPSLSGPSSLVGGNSGVITATNPNDIGTVYLYWDSTSGSAITSDSNSASYNFYPTSAGSYAFAADVGYDEKRSSGRSITVRVTDPAFTPTFSPSASQIVSSVQCRCNSSSGTVEWFCCVGTTEDYISKQTYTYDRTGTTSGSCYRTGANYTLTTEDIRGCISDGASMNKLYFTIGCRITIDEYTTATKWTSGTYQFGIFNSSITNLYHWNDMSKDDASSTTNGTKAGTQSYCFYNQVRFKWTNPTTANLLNYTITNISIQASTDAGATWGTLSTDMITGLDITPGATNIITINYTNYGPVKFRIKLDTTNSVSGSSITVYNTELFSLQCQLSNLVVNTIANLHPYTNTDTVLKFKWFDEDLDNFKARQNGETIKIQFFIREASGGIELESKTPILDTTLYLNSIKVQDDTMTKQLCYDTVTHTYYYNLASPQETNELFFSTLGEGVFDGLYKYRIQLVYDNNFLDGTQAVIISSDLYNANFGQPPTFKPTDEVRTRFYHYDILGNKDSIFNILQDDTQTIDPENDKWMINPQETLVFHFPIATDPNNNLAAYRLEVYRFDDKKIDTPSPENAIGYETLKTYKIGYGADMPDNQYKRIGDTEYIYYTLQSYAYSKLCYFRVVAVDVYEDLSQPIYYHNTIIRSRVTTASLSVENIALGYYLIDSHPQEGGGPYYTYDPVSLRYIRFNGSDFDPSVIYYTKTDGLTTDLKVNIGNQEADLGGNYFRDSSLKYSDYPNLEYYLQNQTTDERNYSLYLQYSNNNAFVNEPDNNLYMDEYHFMMPDKTKTYLDNLLKTSGINFNNGTYRTPAIEDKYTGHKIYIRFKLAIYYGKQNAITLRAPIETFSPVSIIYSSTPTISPRANHMGINTSDFNNDDVLAIAQVNNRYIVRFHGDDTAGNPLDVTINLKTGDISGAIIDGGKW